MKTNGMELERMEAVKIMEAIPALDKLTGEAWYEAEDLITAAIKRILENNEADNCKNWVDKMSIIPKEVMEKLRRKGDDISEVTIPCVGDEIYCFSYGKYGTVTEKSDVYTCILSDTQIVEVESEDIELETEDFFPQEFLMYTFSSPDDVVWLENQNGLEKMSELGFRIYVQPDYGYVFGIDESPYDKVDLFEQYWKPLFKVRFGKEGGKENEK